MIYFSDEHKLEFRSLSDLRHIVCSFSTGFLKPAALCAAFPSTLLYEDTSKFPSHVYWLDCSGTEPKLNGKKINTTLYCIFDICYIRDEKKPLLVYVNGDKVFAYNVVNNKLEWSTKDPSDSVTTDGHNYVLTCNSKNIKLLSLSDGKDLGYLIRDGDQGLGRPVRVRWCSKTTSFIVVHCLNKKYYISTIQFE